MFDAFLKVMGNPAAEFKFGCTLPIPIVKVQTMCDAVTPRYSTGEGSKSRTFFWQVDFLFGKAPVTGD